VGRHLLNRSKFGTNLNPFEINLIRFENRIGRTVLPTPPVSAAPTASPCRTQPLTTGPPIASRPTCQPRRPRRADPAALHCRAAMRRPRAPRPGRCHTDATLPCCSTPRRTGPPHLSLSLSHSASTRVHPSGPPPRRFPLKRSRRPLAENFSHPRTVHLIHP
jgi:hypothetical protein